MQASPISHTQQGIFTLPVSHVVLPGHFSQAMSESTTAEPSWIVGPEFLQTRRPSCHPTTGIQAVEIHIQKICDKYKKICNFFNCTLLLHIIRNVNLSMFTLDTYVLVKCMYFIV